MREWKIVATMAAGGWFALYSGGCLPEDLFAAAAGDVLAGLLVSSANVILNGIGFPV